MSEKKKPEQDSQYSDLGKLPLVPNQMAVAISPYGVLLSFYFIPPEDPSKNFVLARVMLEDQGSLALADALKEAVDQMRKARKQIESKPLK